MATESAMRMVESDPSKRWPSSKDTSIFGSVDMAVEDLGFLLKRHRLHDDRTDNIPGRSGSAPPSMEGSFAAFRNLLEQQEGSSEVLSRAIEKYGSEEEIRSDPAYVAYYFSNINLNPRLPPPLISRENRHLVCQFGAFGDNLSSTSWGYTGKKSFHSSRNPLSTHKEEPEDETSAEQSYVSLAGRHKSLVNIIQEDFPHSTPPMFNQPHSASSCQTAEDLIDRDIHAISTDISSESMASLPESNPGSDVISRETDSLSLTPREDPYGAVSSSHSVNRVKSTNDTSQKGDLLVHGVPLSNASRMMKNQEGQLYHGRRVSMQSASSPHQVHTDSPQITSQRMNGSHGVMENLFQGYPKLSSAEVNSTFQAPGFAPPLYTSTAAYMASVSPYYHNFQPSGLYTSQYNYSGYPPGPGLLPPYMTGFPSHGTTLPVPFDAPSCSSYNARQPAVSSGVNIPPFVDPFQMYFQQAMGDTYGPSFQYGPTGSTNDSFEQKDQAAAFMANQEPHNLTNVSLGLQSPRQMGIGGSNYYTASPCVRTVPQYPGSPLASQMLPSSPVGGMLELGRRNETGYPHGPSRNVGIYPAWQGQRGPNSIDDLKRHPFLDELKSTNTRKFELSDIAGRIVEFSVDQHGSRFIQQKLERCSDAEKESVFSEVLPHASKLITDVFGNYVIQKFLEHGSPAQREELVNQLTGQMVYLSSQMYGCRVIQKALEVMELDQKTELVRELDGHVMRCVRDQNGNHVIQKCIESLPSDRIGFILASFRGQVATLSTHPYGCRVIQRILEHCSDDEQTRCVVDEILESAFALAHDQYGNYVTQHVLERGKPYERSQVIGKITGNVVRMSQHKYASNVVEKCLEHADSAERELLIQEIIGKSEEENHLLAMMKDQFANYVVQKVLEISEDRQRQVLMDHIKVHLQALRKYTYGKHIVARFEQVFGEEAE